MTAGRIGAPAAHPASNLARRLVRHVPHYDKADLRFTDFAPGVETAIERARARTADWTAAHRRNPSTGVWALMERVR
ncbi:hypothetical protein SAMN05421810_104353 [Amycolatopsis arida]|uniref:Uncharacterized protein n=1 Tax=Amycolatopsis arida TaxID=587909 RepID=A0A1I5VFX7_9PSEU|nr:hypothetical protein [Amycolatopsis arida]TDX91269.1 hypothetical protein CLV69_106352 [Amycolatopsis arida]SFQ06380.1 hypothetical protein SAMN05421810_104353 [Amycolatopsis arida]